MSCVAAHSQLRDETVIDGPPTSSLGDGSLRSGAGGTFDSVPRGASAVPNPRVTFRASELRRHCHRTEEETNPDATTHPRPHRCICSERPGRAEVSGLLGGSAGAASKPSPTLTILVTNDDGVSAPGINATVQALTALPHTKVTVVAPAANQSGTGAKVTGGTLTVSDATTASGYPAKAVAGYPADTIIWAIDDHGVSQRPDLVVSGINFGENIGPLASLSGTVGAAQTALARGIPALAVSQGVDNGQQPNFSQGAKYLVAWVQAHRKALVAAKKAPRPRRTATSTFRRASPDTSVGPSP